MSESHKSAGSLNERSLKRCRVQCPSEDEKTFVVVEDPNGDDEVHMFEVNRSFVTDIKMFYQVDYSRGAVILVEDGSVVAKALIYLTDLPRLGEKVDACDISIASRDLDAIDSVSLKLVLRECKRVPKIPVGSSVVLFKILK